MRVTSAQIDLSAQHALTQSHTRREQLAIAVRQADGNTTTQVVRTRERTLSSISAFEHQSSLLDDELGNLNPELQRHLSAGERPTAVAGLSLTTPGSLLERAAVVGLSLPTPESLRDTLNETLRNSGLDLSGLGLVGLQPIDTQLQPTDRFKMQLIRAAVEAFSGRLLKILDPAQLDLSAFAEPVSSAKSDTAESDHHTQNSGAVAGLIYSYQDRHYERETTSFSARGVVHTADGRQIDFEVQLTMGRQFLSETSTEVRLGALEDPLVINFDGTAAELTERTFAFDLDTDGEAEQIHFVGPNSGFLALDGNGNGVIDDGSELFGPTTGSGFGELSAYDEDGNDFIDEGDSIYQRLRIWQKDADGDDHLIALGQAGVGAIYLGSAATPFQVKDSDNQLLGVVRSTGVYLKEQGGVGTVQQLDLVV